MLKLLLPKMRYRLLLKVTSDVDIFSHKYLDTNQ